MAPVTIDDPNTDAEVELEKVRLLFRNTGLAQAVVAINALILLFVLGGLHPPAWSVVWCGIALAVAAARYALARRFIAEAPDIATAPVWERRAIVWTGVAAGVWTAGGTAMMIADPAVTRLFVALVVAGMVAGAVPLLSSIPTAFRVYAVPVLLSIILTALLDAHGTQDGVLALVAALYLAALLRSSHFFHDRLDASLRLAVQMRQMADTLQIALRKAESASTAKTQFLATMSHEIRTPMNGILGMAQLLKMPDVSEEERLEYADIILGSGETLLTLLNDILDMSKVEAGRIELVPVPFGPRQLLDEMAALFSEPAKRKGLALEVDWQGDAEQYLGDAARLRQMMGNLLSNAVKFTGAGTIRLGAREIARENGRAQLEFVVRDTGIGIPADKLDLLFQPFVQVDGSSTRQYGGTGLGLSIVKNLASLMNGKVGASSEAGRGSCFWFSIEVEPIEPMEAGNTWTIPTNRDVPADVDSTPTPSAYTPVIMVVEDNRTNRVVIDALIRKLGLAVSIHEHGQQALDAIRRGDRPAIILMDIHLPVMDGLEATRQIRAWEAEKALKRIPIIALTAGAFNEDKKHCHDAGMDGFMTKPIDIDTLRATLGQWLPRIDGTSGN